MRGRAKRFHSLTMMSASKFYEELPLGRKIMVAHPERAWCPPMDVFECDEAFVIRVALSGLRKDAEGNLENAEVLVERDTIIVRGQRTDRGCHKKCTFYQMDIYYGPFECRVRIARPFDREAITAEYQDGFLEVLVPKAGPETSGPQRINVHS